MFSKLTSPNWIGLTMSPLWHIGQTGVKNMPCNLTCLQRVEAFDCGWV